MNYRNISLIVIVFLFSFNLFLLNLVHKNKLNEKIIVISISDGDTITVLQNNEEKKVRLSDIDAPEKNQPFGTKSKNILANKIFKKEVKIVYSKKDGFGRILGQVYLGDRFINKEMVEEGFAWHYSQFSKSSEIALAQEKAKKEKLGLWVDSNPIQPWEFRKKK
jgi:micrococcal nuclease